MKLTGDQVRQDLKATYDPASGNYYITLLGVRIGQMVRYGKYAGVNRNRVVDVCASRIYGKLGSYELEAGKERSLLNKLAPKLAKGVRLYMIGLPEAQDYSADLIRAAVSQ